MITKVSEQQGVDPNIALTTAAIESGFNPNAKAPTSSAAGLFQFIDSTWKTVTTKYGAPYGITPSTPKTDPLASTIMGTNFLKENVSYISSVKPNVDPTDAYLAHFLGAGGAKTVLNTLKTNPNAVLAQMMPKTSSR